MLFGDFAQWEGVNMYTTKKFSLTSLIYLTNKELILNKLNIERKKDV